MTSDQFDRLTRLISQRASRRSILKGLAASLLGGLFGRAAAEDAEARHTCLPLNRQCRPPYAYECCSQKCEKRLNRARRITPMCVNCYQTPGTPCASNADCCSGICLPDANGVLVCADQPNAVLGLCLEGQDCQEGLNCSTDPNGILRCLMPLGGACTQDAECETGDCCDGICVDTTTDINNCGACGNLCEFFEECCDGTCVDTSTDINNCGACGNLCEYFEDCTLDGCCTVELVYVDENGDVRCSERIQPV